MDLNVIGGMIISALAPYISKAAHTAASEIGKDLYKKGKDFYDKTRRSMEKNDISVDEYDVVVNDVDKGIAALNKIDENIVGVLEKKVPFLSLSEKTILKANIKSAEKIAKELETLYIDRERVDYLEREKYSVRIEQRERALHEIEEKVLSILL